MTLMTPSSADPAEVLADYAELRCLLSERRIYALSDLGALLAAQADAGVPLDVDEAESFGDERAAPTELDPEIEADDQVEECVAIVTEEIGRREGASDGGYPFILGPGGHVLRVRDELDLAHQTYILCLLLTEYRHRGRAGDAVFRPEGVKPEELFQIVSTVAAGGYLGSSVSFGFPRRVAPTALFDALRATFVTRFREGVPRSDFLPGLSVDANDADIDVIAWRHFADNLPGKILLFGQVASGIKWKDKSIITAVTMLRRLFLEPWAENTQLPAIFIPFIFEAFTPRVPARFADRANEAPHRHRLATAEGFGIIFDRCRVTEGVARAIRLPEDKQGSIDEIGRLDAVSTWVDRVIAQLGSP